VVDDSVEYEDVSRCRGFAADRHQFVAGAVLHRYLTENLHGCFRVRHPVPAVATSSGHSHLESGLTVPTGIVAARIKLARRYRKRDAARVPVFMRRVLFGFRENAAATQRGRGTRERRTVWSEAELSPVKPANEVGIGE
jgi:hypothetical protein